MRHAESAASVDVLFSLGARTPFTAARTLERDAADGRLHRIRAGVYANPRRWSEVTDRARARARIAAVLGTRRHRVVLSHESAALLWGLPRLGRWPETCHLVDTRGTAPRSRNGVIWHRTPFDPDEIAEIDGCLVTGLEQTLIDIACTRSFLNAVVALDAALGDELRHDGADRIRGVDRDHVLTRLRAGERRRGSRSAERALLFADERSESVGESLSRGQIHLLGFPPPLLQVSFDRSDGGVDRVDFDWPEFGVFGEFDGDLKYLDPKYRRGRTIEQVILAEKKRADAICRRHRRRAARWDWAEARAPLRLRQTLLEAGLRPSSSPGV